MNKLSTSNQTLTFTTIPATEPDQAFEYPATIGTAAPIASSEGCYKHTPVASPDTSHEPAGSSESSPPHPTFMGQTATAQRLLAALDAQANPITIKGIHFVTPQSQEDSDAMPGALEKRVGIQHVNQKRYAKAVKFLQRARELGQDDYACDMNLGLAYTRLGRLDEAIELLRTLQTSHPFDAGVATLLGKALLLSGKRKEAINVLAPASLTHPDRFHLHYYLGIAHAKLDQTNKAMDAWRKAAAIRPHDKEIKRWLTIGERIVCYT
ncbi:MAG: tetratricopeptide repeat protein [Magnetococcales bacterium]|nr:tetratricopeptide repeat protein [Magnetococcales bacterium]